jgi:DNA invertase Pin-like site-specific DNA recombinase
MPTSWPYIRFSHASSKFGKSEETQLDNLKRYHSFRIPNVPLFQDFDKCTDRVVSAFKRPFATRPAGKFIMDNVKPGDHILVLRMDRIFRRTKDAVTTLEKWTKQGITVHFVDQMIDLSTANGRVFVQMLAVFAEWESAVKSERIRESQALRRTQSLQVSQADKRIPGFKVIRIRDDKTGTNDNQLVLDESQLPLLKRYWDAIQLGLTRRKTEEKIARENCEAAGVRWPSAVCFVPDHLRVDHKTILKAALVWEYIQPILAADAFVPYYECHAWVSKQVEARTKKKKPRDE